jgi:myo-inositol-1-phosphate synthase
MKHDRIGVWFFGALGNVAACTVTGARAMARGLAPPTGMVSALAEFQDLDLVPVDRLVFGGHDVRESDLHREMVEFADRNGAPARPLIDKVKADLRAASRNIRVGTVLNSGRPVDRFASKRSARDRTPLKTVMARLQADIREFQARHRLRSVVAVNVASTENGLERVRGLRTAEQALSRIARNDREGLTSSVLYAAAALDMGVPYVNFTASIGSSLPALDELARLRGVPHAGKDAKTGETLFKTVLAPMFAMRNLRVLSWEGHNILGNRDGFVLNDPENAKMKIADKNSVLRGILRDEEVASHTRIDYVPSLGDWKTAWDFIHFQGFLGAKMTMQVLWQGCDSLLAAPLVLDLVRFAEHAARHGFRGPMTHLACFFKNPFGVAEHNLFRQFEALLAYGRRPREDRGARHEGNGHPADRWMRSRLETGGKGC